MFLKSVSKSPVRFTNMFFWAVDMWALVLVNDSTFLKFVVFVIRDHEKLLYGVSPFEVYMYALFVAGFLELFYKTLYVWDHHGNVPLFVVVGGDIDVKLVGLLSVCWVWVPVVVVFVFRVVLQSV